MTRRPVGPAAIALLLALCAGQPAGAAEPQPAPEPERSSYWRERTSFFRTFAHRAEVVMIGDSLTDGAEWAEMFPDQDIANRGIDSDTTDGVLARIGDVVAARPRQAFVMIGINDFADPRRDVDAVFANYRAIVSRLGRGGVKVVVQSTLPCNEAKAAWKSCASINGKIRQLNARLATLASAGVTFVDLWPLLAADGNLKSGLTYDGVHLNGEGYRLWKRGIAASMPARRKAPAAPR
ncbi:MAG: hypothetical protein JWQ33_507 [Ramlibacter sp.]|nr:hypothetical protein [Ramlibacter sp.]